MAKSSVQSKKSLYQLYPLLKLQIAKYMRKNLPKKQRSNSNAELIAMTFHDNPALIHSLDFLIMAEESLWERRGKHAIFPENAEMVDNLIRAKYEMTSYEGFSLPFDSFIVAMPNGYKFQGVEIPSFMVTIMPYKKSDELSINPFCEELKIPPPDQVGRMPSGENARAICISYQDALMHSLGYGRSMQLDEILPKILACETAQEFKTICGEYVGTHGVVPSENHDLVIQFFAIKFAASLGVYNSATEGDRLIDGFPGSTVPRLITKVPEMKFKYITLKAPTRQPNAPASYYRTWHFRQLRADRYYQGEHENTPRGSRYVFVSDTVVGQKVTAHTQK